jgi:superfamily II RNA helicase
MSYSIDNIMDNATISLTIDPVITNDYESTSTISDLFVPTGTQIPVRYAQQPLNGDQLAVFYSTISNGLIRVDKILADEKAAIEASQKEATKSSKHIKKTDLIKQNMKIEAEKKILNNIIDLMKYNASLLLGNDDPTINSLEGYMNNFTSEMSNNIFKVIVLRCLVQRYKDSGKKELVPLIFEFMMLMKDIKDLWKVTVQAPIAKAEEPEVVTRKTHRKARLEATKQTTKQSDFDFPTVEEITATEFSERIKITISILVEESESIIVTNDINPIEYQMVETYYRLKPISSWSKRVLKIDDWQREIIYNIDNKNSVVIVAPTSSGKTIFAQYCATAKDVKKVLFVVPGSVLAYQVAGSFVNAGIKAALLTNDEEYNVNDDVRVVVATPAKAEEILCNAEIPFDYAVFDEIQQINEFEGEAIERLIKTVNCPFLILSATIHEPEKFIEYLTLVTGREVHLVSYNKRFIVQQKHLWNGDNFSTLHPLACIDHDYIVNDRFTTGDLAMTARDLYYMGKRMNEAFPAYAIWKLDPELYFDKDIPITMDMISEYEKHLKDKLIELAIIDQESVETFLTTFKIDDADCWVTGELSVIAKYIELFKTLQNKELLPALVFMLNDVNVLTTFRQIVIKMEELENRYFPWWNKFLGDLNDDVCKFKKEEPSVRESVAKGITSKGSKIKQIDDTMNQKRRTFILSFLDKIKVKYSKEATKLLENDTLTQPEKDMIRTFLENDFQNKYITYITNQSQTIEIKLPEFNPYGPTDLFSFHKKPISVHAMRRIRKNLKKFIAQSVDKTISKEMTYNNIFMRGLERGIILYSKILPTPFQRIVQELIVDSQAPICICDDSLAYGVNYPTRTVVILGSTLMEDISVLKAQQISGRSGRRGFDTQGHIVYCRVNFKNIMRGTYAPLIGKDTITPYIPLASRIFSTMGSKYIHDVIGIPLKNYMSNTVDEWNKQLLLDQLAELYSSDELYRQPAIMSLLIWLFRDQVDIAINIFVLIDELTRLCAGKVTVSSQTVSGEEIDDDDDAPVEIKSRHQSNTTDDSSKQSKSEIVTVYEMNKTVTLAVVELLFRVLDRTEGDDDIEPGQFVTKSIDFIMSMTSDKWPYPLNMANSDAITCVVQNRIIDETGDYGYIANVVSRVNNVITGTLKIYNVFRHLGQQDVIACIDSALTVLINFNNKIKSLC